MSGHIQNRATRATGVLNGIGGSYDVIFKQLVIKYADKTSNSKAARKCMFQKQTNKGEGNRSR
jgi:hypothetical protein